jgi:hypothetical protein
MPAQDTKLVIRCPYCVLGLDFRPMAAYKDRRFVCEKCGRTVNPEEAAYLCSCCRCLRVKDVSAWLEERWLVVTDGCRRKAVHSFFPHQPYLHPPCGHAEWSIRGFSVQSDYNNYLLPTALQDRKAKRPQDTLHFFACTETIYVAVHEH